MSILCTTTRSSVMGCLGRNCSLFPAECTSELSSLYISDTNLGLKKRKRLGLSNKEHTQHWVEYFDTAKLKAFSF